MKTMIKVFVLTFCITLLFEILRVSAVEYSVGVDVGSWAKYGDIRATFTSNQSEPEPQYIVDMRNTDWIKVVVESVSLTPPAVTVNVITHFKNGTDKTEMFKGDIETGSGNLSFQIISKGLTQGDAVWKVKEPVFINKTLTKTYAGAAREVNYGGYTSPILNGSVLIGTIIEEFYWDKATGFLVGIARLTDMFTKGSMITMEITETNMWSGGSTAPESWLAAVALIVIVIPITYLLIRGKTPPSSAGSSRRRKRR